MKSQEAIALQARVRHMDRVRLLELLPAAAAHNRQNRLGRKHSLAAVAARDGQPTPRQTPRGVSKLAMRAAKAEERANMRVIRRQAIMVRAVIDGPAITPDAGQRQRLLRGFRGAL